LFIGIYGLYEEAQIGLSQYANLILELAIRTYIVRFPDFLQQLEYEMQNHRLCKVVEGKQELVNIVLNKIKEIQQAPPQSFFETLVKFHFSEELKNEAKERIIFGSGKSGQRLIAKLSLSNIQVNYFCDNNPALHGKTILGAKCISFEELKQYKDSAIIYVSTAKADKIYEQLKENDFKYVFPKELMEFVLTL
jgi:FlaA1/EpsC-like NDP-sugar epimerase